MYEVKHREVKHRWQKNQDKVCRNRVYYHSREAAEEDRTSKRDKIYKCPLCHKFHITIW
jgi:hypothetical protein